MISSQEWDSMVILIFKDEHEFKIFKIDDQNETLEFLKIFLKFNLKSFAIVLHNGLTIC